MSFYVLWWKNDWIFFVTCGWAQLRVVCFVIMSMLASVTTSFPPPYVFFVWSAFHFPLLWYDWILFSFLLLLLLPPSIILPSSPQKDDSTGLQMTHNAHTGGWAVEPTLMSIRALTVSLVHVNWNPEKKHTVAHLPQPPPLLALIEFDGWIPCEVFADYFTFLSTSGAGGSCGWTGVMCWHAAAGE